ncbi:VOC family protein [Bifidobacterium aerophilum]|uniref:VOC family protein n=1 Tax=Bifidobacterium aerophilum TaxID=1798155 RepID=A0A6N9Z264_9BIFI|nr:VOC family protein [Bifidobacterium aerophilum]NEG88551.1 VOC family protein [Bifidobacterium aerophilum]
MIDHIVLFVSDAARSADFYEKLLAPVGYERKDDPEIGTFFSNGEDGDLIFLIVPRDDQPVQPVHVAFRAHNEDEVKAFYEAGLAAGGTDNGAPGPRPNYGPTYYAAFIHDPDGNNIEAKIS